jgi:hypothetical protein
VPDPRDTAPNGSSLSRWRMHVARIAYDAKMDVTAMHNEARLLQALEARRLRNLANALWEAAEKLDNYTSEREPP